MNKVRNMNPKQRKKAAFDLFMKGLNSKQIALLLNCSYRTVQNYIFAGQWKRKRKNAGSSPV